MMDVESSFTIVAEPNRRAILSLLVGSERSVGEIERELRLSQPSVSKHLRVLKDAGFVQSRIAAQRRLYRLRAEPFKELDEWLTPFRRFWSKHLDALERHLDRMDADDGVERGGIDRPHRIARTAGATINRPDRKAAAAAKRKRKP
jgi:DNA-binding transcriptional ArsR family regulator